MKKSLRLTRILLLFAAFAVAAQTTLDGKPLGWGNEPVEELSAKRGRIVLNGIWRFQPAVDEAKDKPTGDWGYSRVPGDWFNSWGRPTTVLHEPKTPLWKKNYNKSLQFMWHEREIQIPVNWAGRAILVDFRWISTDAKIFIGEQLASTVDWPTGQVDITQFVTPGQKATLRVKVFAVNDREFTWSFMGVGDDMINKKKAGLRNKGLIGEVYLISRPKGARVSDVFVKTSVRKKKVALDIELTGVKAAGTVKLTAQMVNQQGVAEKTFTGSARVSAKDVQRVDVDWDWADPKLWDYKQPNLYTVQLSVSGAGIDDVYPQRFGFREFRIDGRDMYLNEKPFRFRFMHGGASEWSTESMRATMEDFLTHGWNTLQFWPNRIGRGISYTDDLQYEIADELGLCILGKIGHAGDLRKDDGWQDEKKRNDWLRVAELVIRRSRNCPSVLVWGHSGNCFGRGQGINPFYLGQKGIGYDNDWLKQKQIADDISTFSKTIDPTRPVYTHSGGEVNDLYTANHYLNMIPLQEREQWLSYYMEHGNMPFTPIEFGVPDYLTFHRNRRFHADAKVSEPWQTEFAAIYLGPRAYTGETDIYRSEVIQGHKKDGKYFDWQFGRRDEEQPVIQELLAMFIENTWHSWRTTGTSGGMMAWSDAHGWSRVSGNPFSARSWHPQNLEDRIHRFEFKPGHRGPFQEFVPHTYWHPYSSEKNEILPAGKAMVANNGETLAWIAGAPSFFDKTHSYNAGETVQKQIVLINDMREPQAYSYQVTATIDGKEVKSDSKSGRLKVGEIAKLPLSFSTPAVSGLKLDGEIKLTATVGGQKHEDSFPFRVFKPFSPQRASVVAFDPEGKTTAMLKKLGYSVTPWNGDNAKDMLIIGREAYSKLHVMPGDVAAFVKKGGRVLVFTQHPNWLRNAGYRVSYHVTRRVFPIQKRHPVTTGLDAEDFRDWRGADTLVEAYPEVGRSAPKDLVGYHWGNEHAVASAAIEKPHNSGWRPILECEFDLQYTPLMELDHGNGRMVWCTLDVEDAVAAGDPVAAHVARRIVDYTTSSKLAPRRETFYIGGKKGRQLLEGLGVKFKTGKPRSDSKGLVIIGSDASDQVQPFLNGGSHVLFLARKSGSTLGAKLTKVGQLPPRDWNNPRSRWKDSKLSSLFWGSTDVPDWPEAAGLSISETHFKSFHPATVVSSGVDTGADGLIGRKKVGSGTAIFCQFDPGMFDCKRWPFFRFTRWRHTRAISQLLANLGAEFETDAMAVSPQAGAVSIAGMWKAKLVKPLEPIFGWKNRRKPEAISPEAQALMGETLDESGWQTVRVPDAWASYGEEWANADGEAVYRVQINLPASWAGQDLVLELGQFVGNKKTVDDQDDSFWNGKRVGGQNDYWSNRSYPIPGNLVKGGTNTLAIRVFDRLGPGGIMTPAEQLKVRLKSARVPQFYHPDYRGPSEDWDNGDEPYRWNMW